MRIERIPYLVWLLIGALAGWGIAEMRINMLEAPSSGANMGQERMERELWKKPLEGNPWIRDLVVYPPRDKAVDGREVYVVTAMLLQVDPKDKRKAEYTDVHANLAVPYSSRRIPLQMEQPTVRDFLAAAAKDHPDIHYKYAWWWETNWTYILWGGGAFLLIGVVGPLVLNLAAFGSLGRPPEEGINLRKVRSTTQDKPQRPAEPAGMTAEDEANMAALEASAREFLTEGQPQEPSGAAGGPAPVRELRAGHLEASPTVPSTDGEVGKEYTGEYYPVAHTKKKSNEDAS